MNNLHQEKAPSKRLKLSIVSTLYCSAPYIEEFCRRASGAASCLVGDDYEIILVNDGSPDNSLEIAVNLHNQDAGHIIVVDLSRNFGHHKAIMTGLGYASGEKVFLIDVDLEEDPEWLLSFAEEIEREECDVVFGRQEKRKGGLFESLTGRAYYSLFNWLSGYSIEKNQVTARLMTRRYVNSLLLHTERELNLLGIFYITGFAQKHIIVKKHNTSSTTYTLRHKMSLFLNAVTSFSSLPLLFIFYLGLGISFFAALYIVSLLIQWFFFSRMLSGWPSLIASIWLLGGLNICFIGIIGLYLSRVYSEAKQRPNSIVRRVFGSTKECS